MFFHAAAVRLSKFEYNGSLAEVIGGLLQSALSRA